LETKNKTKYLIPLASGEVIGAFLLSEPEAGSDATHQHTTAEDKGDYYLLNGTKNWITSANSASTYIVMGQTHPDKNTVELMHLLLKKTLPEFHWVNMKTKWECEVQIPIR